MSKALVFLHSRLVVAVSGRCALLSELHRLFWEAWPRGLDDAAAIAPDVFRLLSKELRPGKDPSGPYVGDVVHLLGWSETHGRMAGFTFATSDGFEHFTVEQLGSAPIDAVLQPELPHDQVGGFPADDQALLQLARRQIENSAENVFGGSLFVTELTRDAASTRRAGGLGLPAPRGACMPIADLAQAQATVVVRARVSWAPAPDASVNASGGGVEVRYGVASWPESQWLRVFAEGGATQVDVTGVQQGQLYLFKARYYNPLVNGQWSLPVLHQMGVRSIVVDTPQLAPGSVAPIAHAQQSGATNVYLTEVTLATATIGSIGQPIYVSASVDADGSYSGRTATLRLKLDGVTVVEKEVTSAPDTTAVGNPWYCKGALLQTVIPSPSVGTRTITLTAVGSDATYGVTIENGDLYVEEKRR
ncbi:MAG: fibronectin type III domain-containing protein [Piscinibacter sp.]